MNHLFGKDDKILEFCGNDSNILSDLRIYIPSLMQKLWEKPKLVSLIIEHTDINVLREHLAPFFANNFYENILSYNCIEDNLLYVITLLMQSEINNLNDINQKDKFLVDTPCGIMLEEIYKKVEVQMYLNEITKNAIENLEENHSTHQIDYDLNKIASELNSKLQNEMNVEKKRVDFHQKYSKNLEESALEGLILDNAFNKDMCDFLNSKLSLLSNNVKQKFSNSGFLSFCYTYKNSDMLINLYANKFYITIDFFDRIFNDILNKIGSIPNSLKKICRIISDLLAKKFPTINTVDKNEFIIKFFFNKLLIPFLSNRNIFYYISDNTLYNMKLICNILKRCINGDFFTFDESEFSFTPFNWYTIYNFDKIINVYQNLTKVQISSYLENLINNKLPPDFEYDYYNENPEKIANAQSILYNINQLKAIITTIEKNTQILFLDNKNIMSQKSIQKLMEKSNINIMENIINEEKKDIDKYNQRKNNKKEKKKEDEELPKIKIKYFLFAQLCLNKKYEKYLETRPQDNFYIKPNKESKEENDIINFKNNLVYLLNKIKQLEKTDFDEKEFEIDNTEYIINKLYYSLSNLEFGDSNFSKLSAEYILENLEKIPENSRENYLKKIYNELEKDIKESIKEIDLGVFSNIFEILKFNNKYEANIKKYFEILKDYEEKNEVRKIVKEYFIPVDLIFEYVNNEKSKFDIKESSFKEKVREKEDKIKKYERVNKVKLCLTIEEFTKGFPDIIKYQSNYEDNDILAFQEKIGIPDKIDKYMAIIKEKLTTYNIKNLDEIMNKIFDYVMEKIYDKCCPNQPNKFEKEIFRKCISLNWIEQHHLNFVKNELFLGNSEKDISNYIKLFQEEKSIRKKLMIFEKINNSILLIVKYSKAPKKNYDIGVDDILPILCYLVIKSTPLILYSNLRFIEIYKRNITNKNIGAQFTWWKITYEKINNMTYNDFKDITQEEFDNAFISP